MAGKPKDIRQIRMGKWIYTHEADKKTQERIKAHPGYGK